MTGYVNPDKETFAAFRALPDDGPIHMLNLVRVRDWADYGDGRKVSGKEAYRAYGRESGPIFRRVGGKQHWIGRFDLMLTGPKEEKWDFVFIAEYPSAAAFVAMIRDPDYREAVKHRTAAVADSRLVRLKPMPPGENFGE